MTVRAIRELIESALGERAGRPGSPVDPAAALRFAQRGLAMLCQALEDRSDACQRAIRPHSDFFVFAPDACLVTDASGVVCDANLAAEELLGVPAALLRNRPLVLFVALDERAAFRGRLRALASGGGPRTRRWRAGVEHGSASPLAIEFSVRDVRHANQPITRLCWLLRRAPAPAL